MLTIYGIKACDTMKRAFTFLNNEGVDYAFHDYKSAGLSVDLAHDMIAGLSKETLVNKRGTTWRKLPADEQSAVDAGGAAEVLAQNTSLAKRPVWRLEKQGAIEWRAGFPKGAEDTFKAWLSL